MNGIETKSNSARLATVNTVKITSGNAKMIAHRGVSGLERENTSPAFIAAGNRSYFGIETDVRKTADGKYVVIHDEDTSRITGGKTVINVEKSNYDDFKNVILPDLDESYDRMDIRIPLLEEYVKICKKYEKKCVLELKRAFSKNDLKEIIDIIRSQSYLENVIFISFFYSNCEMLRLLVPENDIQFLTSGEASAELVERLIKYRLGLDISYKNLDKDTVDMLHSKGIPVNCWTVDNKEIAEELVEWGVDFITTNILE